MVFPSQNKMMNRITNAKYSRFHCFSLLNFNTNYYTKRKKLLFHLVSVFDFPPKNSHR